MDRAEGSEVSHGSALLSLLPLQLLLALLSVLVGRSPEFTFQAFPLGLTEASCWEQTSLSHRSTAPAPAGDIDLLLRHWKRTVRWLWPWLCPVAFCPLSLGPRGVFLCVGGEYQPAEGVCAQALACASLWSRNAFLETPILFYIAFRLKLIPLMLWENTEDNVSLSFSFIQ